MDTTSFSKAIEALERSTTELKNEIRKKSDDLAVRSFVMKALQGLRTGWRDADPGKYGQHWFFVKRYATVPADVRHGHFATLERCDRFWVRELVSNPEAAAQGVPMARPHGGPLERKPPPPLGDFGETKKEPCPSCRKESVIIGCYEQTEDGPDGDTWEIHLYALCLGCPGLFPVAKRCDENRLSHLLSWPAS